MTFKQKMGLAAAVSAALGFSGAAGAAANIHASSSGNVFTTEALASALAATENFNFYIQDLVYIAPDNTLTLAFSGIALTNTSAPTVTCNGTALVPVVGTGAGGVYEYVNNSGSIIQDPNPAKNTLSSCYVTGVSTTIAKLKAAGDKAQLNVSAKLFSAAGGVEIDQAVSGRGSCLPLAAVVQQYSAAVDTSENGLNATIDLTSGSFGVDFTTQYSRALKVQTKDYCSASYPVEGACVLGVNGGQTPKVQTVVTGNFSFADNGSTGCDDSAAAVGATVGTDAYLQVIGGKVNVGCGSVTSYSYAPGNYTYVQVESGTSAASGGSELLPFAVGSFTQETSVTWQKALNTPASETLSSGAAGSWTTNGLTAFIPYMPYDAQGTLSRVIYVTNATGKDGKVSVTVGAEGTACTDRDVVTAVKGGVTQLSGAVDAAVASCFPTLPANGKVWVSVSAEFPSQNGSQIYSAYVQNGQRYIVINTSNNNTL